MKNYMIKTCFVSPEGPKTQADKTCFYFMIFIFIVVEICMLFGAIHDFLVWLRTGSNPADSKRFRSHTGKFYI